MDFMMAGMDIIHIVPDIALTGTDIFLVIPEHSNIIHFIIIPTIRIHFGSV